MTPTTPPNHSPSTPSTWLRLPPRNSCVNAVKNLHESLRQKFEKYAAASLEAVMKKVEDIMKDGFEESHRLFRQWRNTTTLAQAEIFRQQEQLDKKVDDVLKVLTKLDQKHEQLDKKMDNLLETVLIEQQRTAIDKTLVKFEKGNANLKSAIDSVTELSKTMSTIGIQMDQKMTSMKHHEQLDEKVEVLPNRNTLETSTAVPKPVQSMPFCIFCRVNGHRSEDCRTYRSSHLRTLKAIELGICIKCKGSTDNLDTLTHTGCPAQNIKCDNCNDDAVKGDHRYHDKVFCPMIKIPQMRSLNMFGQPCAERGKGRIKAFN
uniref:CCHC-type domain-containing protein n=1 Tax=Caenorhabditis tropicalis TaxID=1561998 RepID=A0A1I7TTZ0_9PELO